MNKRIKEIRARCDSATPGPWEEEKYYHGEPYEQYIKSAAVIANKGESAYTITRNDWSNPVEADLDFIAHAREDIPYLLREIDRLRQWINDLQSGMYVNCVYCGHQYGPSETTPVSMADALKAHIEQCPEHPMSHLKTQLAESQRRELAAVEDLYEACKGSPCNNGICVKKNCAGNIIPCEFKWRGVQGGDADVE